jgi:hypothetical protein
MRSVWLGLVVAVACGGNGGADHPGLPPVAGGSGGGSHAGSSSAAGEGAQTAEGGTGAAEGGAAGADAEAGAGARLVFESAGAPPTFPPGVCNPDMMLGTEQAQDVGVADVTLLAMTTDELSVAFTTGSADTLALHVADRASTEAAFTEVSVTLPVDYDAASGVTLSSDGLTLVLVSQDHASLGALSRAQRGDAFAGDIDTAAFDKLNSLKEITGDSLGWPLLSKDGKTLYYVSYAGSALVTECTAGQDGVFDFGTQIDEFTLGGSSGKFKLLSGLATDERAIFFYDQESKHSMALFRSHDGAPFYDPVDLGDRRGAAPNADCSRVYSSVSAGVVAQAIK